MGPISMSPTARSLRTLELLKARPGITADELAERLDVTTRAVRRYIAILREAGVSVESRSGPYGGYRLGRGLRIPPLQFTATEALGLVMAVLDGHHAADDPDDPVGSALGKLIQALPDTVGRQAAATRQHARASPDRSSVRPDPLVISTLVDAIADHRRVHLTYNSSSGNQLGTEVDPWAVVVRHGRWYLLCHAHHVNAGRNYRIDRVEALDVLDAASSSPDDLDPVAWLEQNLGSGWEYDTHVVFDAPVEAVAPYVAPPMGQLEAVDDGARCELRGTTGNPAMYAGEWLAAIPYRFAVVAGPELRDAVAAVGQRMTDAVSQKRQREA